MTDTSELTYTPAWWVPGPHLQTLWGKLARRVADVPARLERWDTPDGDEIELHRLDASDPNDPRIPRLLLLHGLEGTMRSHYLKGTLALAQSRGWAADVLVFRGCGSRMNRARRMYHSGETSDLAFVVERLVSEHPEQPLVLGGFSLGGNVLLKWLGERGRDLPPQLKGAVAMSVPFDLERGCRHIEQGFSRIYNRHFLRTLKVKAAKKLAQFPDAFDREALESATTLYAFDDAVTAPVHGFKSASDYYSQSSSLGFLSGIRTPTLLLSAIDDPFLPREVLDDVRIMAAYSGFLSLEFRSHGGHVGFVSGRLPFRGRFYGEERMIEFLANRLRPEPPAAAR